MHHTRFAVQSGTDNLRHNSQPRVLSGISQLLSCILCIQRVWDIQLPRCYGFMVVGDRSHSKSQQW